MFTVHSGSEVETFTNHRKKTKIETCKTFQEQSERQEAGGGGRTEVAE